MWEQKTGSVTRPILQLLCALDAPYILFYLTDLNARLTLVCERHRIFRSVLFVTGTVQFCIDREFNLGGMSSLASKPPNNPNGPHQHADRLHGLQSKRPLLKSHSVAPE